MHEGANARRSVHSGSSAVGAPAAGDWLSPKSEIRNPKKMSSFGFRISDFGFRISDMAFVHINPRYQALLGQHGLSRPEDLLELPAVIVSGHPDRHVARVMLGGGTSAQPAFIKREHRVRWRDRFLNAAAGFGFVSKCHREAQTLRALARTGIGCPEWMADGEDERGRAFLLVRALPGAVDLRLFLRDHLRHDGGDRQRFARRLGHALARIHEAGFDHPDIYAKHIMVDPASESVWFLDWQRSRRRIRVGTAMRQRDLAALDATVANNLADPRDRLRCLRSYLRAANFQHGWKDWAGAIRRRTRRMLAKRHVRDGRLCPLPGGTQELLWLDGDALCVTRSFWTELQGRVPDWLRHSRSLEEFGSVSQAVVTLPGGGRGLLVRGRRRQPLRWLWTEFRRRPFLSPELRQAGALFRMQRRGLRAPRLLAFGQRRPMPWQLESFLLTELESDTRPLPSTCTSGGEA
jgi:tRNA A-37 threonylcarbamoyl transferase component Bud32